MSLNIEDIKKSVSTLFSVSGIEGVVIATSDGLPLYSSLGERDLEEKVAALTAVLSEVGSRTSAELGKGEAEWISVHASDGSGIILVKIGDVGYMAVLFGREAKLGILLYYIRSVKNRLEKLG